MPEEYAIEMSNLTRPRVATHRHDLIAFPTPREGVKPERRSYIDFLIVAGFLIFILFSYFYMPPMVSSIEQKHNNTQTGKFHRPESLPGIIEALYHPFKTTLREKAFKFGVDAH